MVEGEEGCADEGGGVDGRDSGHRTCQLVEIGSEGGEGKILKARWLEVAFGILD